MAVVLIPLPGCGFDPTEAAVPWLELVRRGHAVRFATPDGGVAQADPRMLHGTGLGPLRGLLRADAHGREAYRTMHAAPAFNAPWSYAEAARARVDGLLLPGGHAPGMRAYLESSTLQAITAQAFAQDAPVGAICHGVVLAARARNPVGRSVLYGRRTTALTRVLELAAWALTAVWLGNYYRTYPVTVQAEVTTALARPGDFEAGPVPLRRDSPQHLEYGYTVRDGNYLSARWPGDAHRFAADYAGMLEQCTGRPVAHKGTA
ncbi:MAG: type 1 glutamine amidotransferase domain-containing protein [Halioglobus sp.]